MINSTPGSNTVICSFLGRQRWENISHASFAGAALNDVLKEDSAAYEAQMGANRLKIDRSCGAAHMWRPDKPFNHNNNN